MNTIELSKEVEAEQSTSDVSTEPLTDKLRSLMLTRPFTNNNGSPPLSSSKFETNSRYS